MHEKILGCATHVMKHDQYTVSRLVKIYNKTPVLFSSTKPNNKEVVSYLSSFPGNIETFKKITSVLALTLKDEKVQEDVVPILTDLIEDWVKTAAESHGNKLSKQMGASFKDDKGPLIAYAYALRTEEYIRKHMWYILGNIILYLQELDINFDGWVAIIIDTLCECQNDVKKPTNLQYIASKKYKTKFCDEIISHLTTGRFMWNMVAIAEALGENRYNMYDKVKKDIDTPYKFKKMFGYNSGTIRMDAYVMQALLDNLVKSEIWGLDIEYALWHLTGDKKTLKNMIVSAFMLSGLKEEEEPNEAQKKEILKEVVNHILLCSASDTAKNYANQSLQENKCVDKKVDDSEYIELKKENEVLRGKLTETENKLQKSEKPHKDEIKTLKAKIHELQKENKELTSFLEKEAKDEELKIMEEELSVSEEDKEAIVVEYLNANKVAIWGLRESDEKKIIDRFPEIITIDPDKQFIAKDIVNIDFGIFRTDYNCHSRYWRARDTFKRQGIPIIHLTKGQRNEKYILDAIYHQALTSKETKSDT